MRSVRLFVLPGILALLLGLGASSVEAGRTLLSQAALKTTECARCVPPPQPTKNPVPPSEGEIEGPCGLAVSLSGGVYLADYYHRAIDVFTAPSAFTRGEYLSQLALPGTNPVFGVNTLDSVCGLAFDAAGNLYGNEWHEGVVRLTGGEATIDEGESTGLAIDPSTDRLYVDDRTYIAEYKLPLKIGAKPLATIGLGSLDEGYGLAAAEGRVYAADAGDDSVKVFEPSAGDGPVATISGQFTSLTDAALAIDPGNGHLLVVDNRQPGFEHPLSAVLEFNSAAGGYAFLGQLPGAPIDGEPSGIAVLPDGTLLVTDGNSELSNAFLYSPYEGAGLAAPAPAGSATAAAARGAGDVEGSAMVDVPHRRSSASASEVIQSGGIRAGFEGKLSPSRLPRRGSSPVRASVGVKIIPLNGHPPPQLRRIEIAINRNGRFSPGAVPVCNMDEIQPATTQAALAACRRSLVGEGTFSAKVLLPEQAPFPSAGKVYAFNGRWHGRPAIFAHVYGTEPLPVSYTLPFELVTQRGTFGTLLRSSLPAVTGNSGYITSIALTLGRDRYLTAGCPAPAGIRETAFPFARADLAFAGGRKIGETLTRSCRARG
jgi:DNA-binding beta-propeller fold protein YncE